MATFAIRREVGRVAEGPREVEVDKAGHVAAAALARVHHHVARQVHRRHAVLTLAAHRQIDR